MSRRLVLFAKEPVAGAVKTRLAAGVGGEMALRLYQAFLEDLSRELRSAAWEAVLAHGEPEPGPFLRQRFAGWSARPQGDGNLGERLAASFEAAFGEGISAQVVVGSDVPTLTGDEVTAAFERLEGGADVVAAPSPDGGYSLIGLARGAPARQLFAGVRWSSEHALSDTWEAAGRAPLRAELLPELPDVDVAEDLAALRRALARRPGLAPATRRILEGS